MFADLEKRSGILMHLTSLPGPYGIGSLGGSAARFADAIASAGMSYWQMLPVHPTVFANSPYLSSSSYAGNPLLINLDWLKEHEWLTGQELADHPPFRDLVVRYEVVIPWHQEMRTRAYNRFMTRPSQPEYTEFRAWCAEPAQSWLDDFSLYMTLKEINYNHAWVEWPDLDKNRDPQNEVVVRDKNADQINRHKWFQWVFLKQWSELKEYVKGRLSIIGDMPFYVGHDCCETWTDRNLFLLKEDGHCHKVAGVGPDSFSKDGQLWGNPIYDWEQHRASGYRWWADRIDRALELYDYVRIDHFRAFESFYEIPAEHKTAMNGQWVDGVGKEFFDLLGPERCSRLIAEDLGDRMEKAEVLRDEVGLPGMIVIQFAIGGNPEEIHRFDEARNNPNRLIYLGTHDNNTIVGWYFNDASTQQRDALERLIGSTDRDDFHWKMIEYGMGQYEGRIFIVSMQDLLGLDASARMNVPSVTSGNWEWRITPQQFDSFDWARLLQVARQSGRAAE